MILQKILSENDKKRQELSILAFLNTSNSCFFLLNGTHNHTYAATIAVNKRLKSSPKSSSL